MIALIIAIPLVGGLLAAAWPRGARPISFVTLIVGAALTLWVGQGALTAPWIPSLGAGFRLVVDGLSLPLILLTWGLGLVAVGASTGVHERKGFYHLNVLWVIAGVLGVFLAADLLLLFVFWELMLVPMYLLIGIWGYGDRLRAALRFFVFTQASGLLMLVAILGLGLAHAATTGDLTFDYGALRGATLDPTVEVLLMLGFLVAFLVKVPAVPLHTWLPEAHTQAPTGGSVLLAGLMLKTGGYGLIRFVVPLFPNASAALAPALMIVGVLGVLYGAALAFAQTDAKRLVAYSSVSHMGFVILAVFAWNELALQGALLEMICHGLSTGGLFVVVGMLQHRLGTRDLRELGGLWAQLPRLGAVGFFLALATLALPGTGNFVAEFLCLLGAWQRWPLAAAIAAVGMVLSAVYALWFVQQVFHGPPRDVSPRDLGVGETVLGGAIVVALLWLGLWPQPVFDTADQVLRALAPPSAVVEGA